MNDDIGAEVEIIAESISSRKRKADDNEGDDSVDALRAKLLQAEQKIRDVTTERDYFRTCALASHPNLKASQVHTHDIEVSSSHFLTSDDYRSPAFRVDDIEIRVGLKELNSYSKGYLSDERPQVVVTPYISKKSEDAPRAILALVTVRQRSVCRRTRKKVYCDLSVNTLIDKPTEFIGSTEEFEPTDDLSHSYISIRLTVVVQKSEIPGGGSDAKVVVVQGKTFYVSAAYLSQWSRYFRAYFEADMEEKKTGIYPVKDEDITSDDFQEMLLVIYPTQKPITEDNLDALLRLANRFEMPDLTRRVENFLIDFNSHSLDRAIVFLNATDLYDLPLVQATLLHRWRDAELLRTELLTSEVYNKLSPATKNMVNQRFADASIVRSATSSNQRLCSYHSDDE